MSIGICKRDFR